jgi:hypothetical protein
MEAQSFSFQYILPFNRKFFLKKSQFLTISENNILIYSYYFLTFVSL